VRKLEWIPLLIIDEVGYIPLDPQAANLMLMLVSSRYERASLIVTSNNPSPAGARSSATRSWPPP
jgi:DNA replication protein DnaC